MVDRPGPSKPKDVVEVSPDVRKAELKERKEQEERCVVDELAKQRTIDWYLLIIGAHEMTTCNAYGLICTLQATNSKELRAAERRSIGGAWSAGAIVMQGAKKFMAAPDCSWLSLAALPSCFPWLHFCPGQGSDSCNRRGRKDSR
ncbi:hypothetical protein HaLaN_24433, partial [Haematococcus lacustris]